MPDLEILDELRTRIQAGESLLFLQTHEEQRWTARLSDLAQEMDRGVLAWSVTRGTHVPGSEESGMDTDPQQFLGGLDEAPRDTLFLVEDFHPWLTDPRTVRRLRDLSGTLPGRGQALLFMGPGGTVPDELRKQSLRIQLPLPGLAELLQELAVVIETLRSEGSPLAPSEMERERLAKTVLGLTAGEARRAFSFALRSAESITDDVYAQLISEKRQMVQGSDLLEFYDLEAGADAIGGLDGLKDWLRNRADAFSSVAREQGIPLPKGVFLVGVQGCGKSLTARVTASLLRFPLVRLDTSALLSTERGASEKNLREVLKLVETVAPVVLWIDEIDKSFAGFEDEAAGDATMSRIVGAFLTWMEERRSQVFVVATANSVHRLPPELLRRGRFDEMFFVDLPNFEERKSIFSVHLQRRGWNPEKFDLDQLAEESDGFSGAEIEQIVGAAMLESYAAGRILSVDDILEQRELTVPLSTTKEDEIFDLREWARVRCRPATPDSRVAQMLEGAARKGELESEGPSQELLDRWRQLADAGQTNAAVIEYIRPRTAVSLLQIQEDFADLLPCTGEIGLALKADPNVVLWSGLSPELAEVLAGLIKNRRVFLHAAPASFYDAESLPFSLPALDALPEEKTPRPSWLPVTLQVSPAAGGSERMTRVARIKLSRSKGG